MPDINSRLTVTTVLAPAVYATDQAENSADIDLGGHNSQIISFIFGALTDGTYTPKLEYSDDGGSTWDDVAAEDIQGTLTVAAFATDDDTVQTVGYIGMAGMIRAVITVAASTTGGLLAITATRDSTQQLGGSSIIT